MFTCSPGVWKVVAKFQNNPQESFAAEFEVKEYGIAFILCQEMARKLESAPPWAWQGCVLLILQFCQVLKWNWNPRVPFFMSTVKTWSSTSKLRKWTTVNYSYSYYYSYSSCLFLSHRYLFGEEVNGNAHVVFGFMKDGPNKIKKSFPSSLQRVPVSIPVIWHP